MLGRLAATLWDWAFEQLFHHYSTSSHIARRHLALRDGGLVLDVGGGTGGVAARLPPDACRVVVVDPHAARVRRGRATYGAAAKPRRTALGGGDEVASAAYRGPAFVRARGEALPFPDACADAALLVEVLHHVQDDRGLLAEVARVLRPGGRLLIEESEFDGRYRYRYWIEKLAYRGLWPRTRAGLRARLESLGFTVRPLEEEGFVILATRR